MLPMPRGSWRRSHAAATRRPDIFFLPIVSRLSNTNTPGPPSRWLLRTQSQVAFNHTSSEAARVAPSGGGPGTAASGATRQRSAPRSFALHERHRALSPVSGRRVPLTAASRQRRYTTSGSGRASPSAEAGGRPLRACP